MTVAWIAMSLVMAPAMANEEDKAACAELEEGDACIDHNSRDGTCVPDDSDPSVLTCESNEDIGTNDTGTDDTGTDDTGSDNGEGGGDADKAACEGADEGDACIDHNDRDGTCVPDDSDPGVLTCESDEDLRIDASSFGACNAVGSGSAGGALVVLLAGLGLARRRQD